MAIVLEIPGGLSINNSLMDFTNFKKGDNRATTLLNNIDGILARDINTTVSILEI